jgi:hypothetical protein
MRHTTALRSVVWHPNGAATLLIESNYINWTL